MASATRAPTSDEAVAGTWTGSAGSRWQVVDDYPDASGTDELTHGTTAGTLTFGFSAFSLPVGAANIQVHVDYYDYKSGSQACTFGGRLKVGASYFNATTHNPGNGSANRTQRTDSWTTNPGTSTAWTREQINGTAGSNNLAAFGYNSGSDASPTILTSSVQLRVTYDEAIAGTGVTTPDALTLGAAGTVSIVGAGSSAPDALTLTAEGTVEDSAVTGSGVAAPDALTLAADGSIDVVGSGGTAPSSLTLGAEGAVSVVGSGGTTPDAVALTSSGSVSVVGASASTPGALAVTSEGTVSVEGSGVAAPDALTLTATGTVSDPGGVVGTGVVSPDALGVSAAGAVSIVGAGTATPVALTLSAAGTVSGEPVRPPWSPPEWITRFAHVSSRVWIDDES